MASVFLALDLALDRKVAIKVMSPALASSPDNIERFKREAKVAASLNHPNIIGILAVGDDPDLAYFVMKYVEGRSLDSVIKETGGQTVPFVQTVIGSAGKALNYAHTRGIIHRDVKPANFMLDQDGWLIVTDFGIAKLADTKGLTMTGSIIGTPYYMSPEQFNGKAITGATDQYALGIVAYELLTGKQPYTGDTIAEVMRGHLIDDPPSVRAVRPDVPEVIDLCITKMLAKNPADRYATLEDAVLAFGGVSQKVEVEVRTQIISLAKSGMMQQPRMSVPVSPVPAQRPPKPAAGAAAAAKTKPAATKRVHIEEEHSEEHEVPVRRKKSSKMPVLVGLLLFIVAGGGVTAWLRPDLASSLRARLLGMGGGVLSAPIDSAAIRDSLENARVAALVRADSILRADSVARVIARADSIVRADSLTRAAAARAAAGRRTQVAAAPPRTAPAARPAATPPTPAVRPSIPTAGAPAAAIATPPAASTAPTTAVAKDGAAAQARTAQPQSSIPVAGQAAPAVAPQTAPPPAPVATGPGTIRIGSRIPLAVLYLGDEVRPIGEQGLQTLSFPAGPVRISIRAEKCVQWDTTFTVVAGQVHTIGYRPSRC